MHNALVFEIADLRIIADLVKIRLSLMDLCVTGELSATGIARAMKTYELANPHYPHCSHCSHCVLSTLFILFTLSIEFCSHCSPTIYREDPHCWHSCPCYTDFRVDTGQGIIPMPGHTVCTFVHSAL